MARATRHDTEELGLKSFILAVWSRMGVCAPTYMVLVEALPSVEVSAEGVILDPCEAEGFCLPGSEFRREQMLMWCLPRHALQLEDERQSLLR